MTVLDLHSSLVRGRRAVEAYITECRDQLGEYTWDEEHATVRLTHAAHPVAKYIPFTRNQEGGTPTSSGTGADWLWWWLSSSGECFGMLVQAKNLKRVGRRWDVDLNYAKRRQIIDLLNASDLLKVPAVYALYCGDLAYRLDLTCGAGHTAGALDRCHRSAVCVLPALIASQLATFTALDSQGQAAIDAYQYAFPLEDLADNSQGTPFVDDLNLHHIDGELLEFLTQPQGMPRDIAKKIFGMVSRMRSGQFALAVSEHQRVGENVVVFGDLPADRGHFGVPYFDHVLRGLRRQPPDYLVAVANGEDPAPWLSRLVAGIVLFDAV
ncbi:hypothetical protein [Micromonospora sp. KC213]|uniref:hypothetical protein n=1 Tax=Micromonospora sp. KC213 TaxID=2530378 RepID=UPI00104C4400|nr:hypothetical protein [Micromonospora sp. KC213]TDC41537.1 hypothetical protein E1166_11340 [Micromonospora sp. KC213]